MGYNWGNIMRATLYKLDLEDGFDDPIINKWKNRFTTYANEAITQICNSVKPKPCYFTQKISVSKAFPTKTDEYSVVTIEVSDNNYEDVFVFVDEKLNNGVEGELRFAEEYDNIVKVYKYITGTDSDDNIVSGWQYLYTKQKDGVFKFDVTNKDFISFSDNRSYLVVDEYNIYTQKRQTKRYTLNDEYFRTIGYNTVIVKYAGTYEIAYNGRWIDFYELQDNLREETFLDVPNDILDCIPSYIASQLYGIDDEYKSTKYRNEFEMLLSRIDNKPAEESTTIGIKGDW